MKQALFKAAVVVLCGFMAAAAGAQGLREETNAAEGHRLALKICSACHVVAADQQSLPILRPPAPSFQAIANRPQTTLHGLQTFILKTHATIATPGNMPNPELTEDQAEALALYVLNLRSGH
jgi:mono/diheme cytochrome c family protein